MIRLFHLHTKETEEVIEPHIHPTDGPLLMGEIINLVAGEDSGKCRVGQ